MKLPARRFTHSGRTYRVPFGVFDPVRHLSGIAFADALPELLSNVTPQPGVAIDLGTGCGLLAATLAANGCHVVATDISQRAVRCARANCEDVDVDVRHGDLFDAVTGLRVDLLVVNPPYERTPARNLRSRAFTSADFLERLAAEWQAVSDQILLGFPAEDASVLSSAGLNLRMIRRLPTSGADLGIFTQ